MKSNKICLFLLKDNFVNVTADTASSRHRICVVASVVYRIQFKLCTKDSILVSTVLHNKLFTFTMLPLSPPVNTAVLSPLSFLTSLVFITNSTELFNSVTLAHLISSFYAMCSSIHSHLLFNPPPSLCLFTFERCINYLHNLPSHCL
jgi:hypothetical protein